MFDNPFEFYDTQYPICIHLGRPYTALRRIALKNFTRDSNISKFIFHTRSHLEAIVRESLELIYNKEEIL